jgi:hypothetical protein
MEFPLMMLKGHDVRSLLRKANVEKNNQEALALLAMVILFMTCSGDTSAGVA